MTTTQNAPATQTEPAKSAQILGDFGDGRYSPLMREIYSDVKRIFKLSEKAADKVARRAARDFGDVMSSYTQIGLAQVKTGKVNSDNKLTVGEAATKVKNVTQTFGILVIRMLKFIQDSEQFGLDKTGTKWQPAENLTKWFAKLEAEQ